MVLHGILAYALPRWSFDSPTEVAKPMELILVDKPEPKKVLTTPTPASPFEDKPTQPVVPTPV